MKLRLAILFTLLTLITTGWLGFTCIERLYEEPENYSQIEDGLWMGGDTLKPPQGTYAVFNLCEKPDVYESAVYVHDPIRDAGPAPKIAWLKEKVDFVAQHHGAGKITYVHCFNGASRSGLVVTAYMMRKHGWSRDEAIAKIRAKREQIKPNPAFIELLTEWEKQMR